MTLHRKIWWLGFAHLLAMPMAAVAEQFWLTLYCIVVASACLLDLAPARDRG